MIDRLHELEQDHPLTQVQKILLTTDGSVTRILEALRGREIKVITVVQEVVEAGAEVRDTLGLDHLARVNHRVVWLKDGDESLVHATSYCPVDRLDPDVKEDVMRGDIPIGRIMKDHGIEARREIRSLGTIRAGSGLAGAFGLEPGTALLERNYNIIHKGRVFMNITEVFSPGI